MRTNKFGQTPQLAARARVLNELNLMASEQSMYFAGSEDTDSFHLQVRKHYAKINNELATRWGLHENVIDLENIKNAD